MVMPPMCAPSVVHVDGGTATRPPIQKRCCTPARGELPVYLEPVSDEATITRVSEAFLRKYVQWPGTVTRDGA